MEIPELVDYVKTMYEIFKKRQEEEEENQNNKIKAVYYRGLVSAYKDVLSEIEP